MIRRPMTVSGDVVVAAEPMHLYELVSERQGRSLIITSNPCEGTRASPR